MTTDLDKLESQIAELQQKRQTILGEARKAKLTEVKAIVKQFGFTSAELGLTATGAARKGTAARKTKLDAKYANPLDSKQTWHGSKGARPTWVKQFLASGGNLADIAIKKG